MSSGIHKKLARARSVCQGAGFLLQKLEYTYGSQFGEGMRAQVRQAIQECRQQGEALMAIAAHSAVEAERMHEQRTENIAKAGGAAA